jgi:serine phosphatase RsbU (regulator of sigma subunit)
VVSDGIVEARQRGAGGQFGVERTIAAIDAAGATASSSVIADSIRAALDGWMAGSPAADDQTLLIASIPG